MHSPYFLRIVAFFISQQLLFQFNYTNGSTRTVLRYEGYTEYQVIEQNDSLWPSNEKDNWVTYGIRWVADDGRKPRHQFRNAHLSINFNKLKALLDDRGVDGGCRQKAFYTYSEITQETIRPLDLQSNLEVIWVYQGEEKIILWSESQQDQADLNSSP